jgi:hypothetical protein
VQPSEAYHTAEVLSDVSRRVLGRTPALLTAAVEEREPPPVVVGGRGLADAAAPTRYGLPPDPAPRRWAFW